MLTLNKPTSISTPGLNPEASLSSWATTPTLLQTRRNISTRKKTDLSHRVLLDDLWEGEDEFRKAPDGYVQLKTVTPVLNPQLEAQIQALILQYESNTGARIPPAWQRPALPGSPHFEAMPQSLKAATNKIERLKAALWILSHLPAASNRGEAANQIACVLDRVELLAKARARHMKLIGLADPKPLRLPEPTKTTINAKPLWISYGIRHVILLDAQGGIQIQNLPNSTQAIDFQKNAQTEGHLLLNKSGSLGCDFW